MEIDFLAIILVFFYRKLFGNDYAIYSYIVLKPTHGYYCDSK